jgi:CDK inhibitor PHO81
VPLVAAYSSKLTQEQAQVPTVVQGIKDTGLLVGTFGTAQETTALAALGPDVPGVDAVLGEGLLTCLEQSVRALV